MGQPLEKIAVNLQNVRLQAAKLPIVELEKPKLAHAKANEQLTF